jgi:hypothetical protein
MAATSSAKPAKLVQYRNGGLAQVEVWEPEVGNLRTALEELRSALATADLPAECDVTVLFYDTWFDTLTKNQRHLDEWVGDVADGFVRASGGDPASFDATVDPDRVVTAADERIVVGFADRARSEQQARDDAATLDRILGETGLVHPDDLANDPERLEQLAERYPELRDVLARSSRFAADEDYAVTLVTTLGPQNVRTMADLANTFGIAQDRGVIDGDAYAGYVVPFATLLAGADRSGRLDPDVRRAIFDMDATDEPPVAGTDPDFIRTAQLQDMRYRSLALLVGVGGFSPRTTADMADEIIRNGPTHPEFYDYSGFTDPVFLRDHRELASNEWAALSALGDDDHAANLFFRIDHGSPGDLENLYLMGGHAGSDVAGERLAIPGDEAQAFGDELLADAMRGGIQRWPLTTGTVYAPETTDLVTNMIHVAGADHVDASDPVRRVLAEVSTPYTRDLAITASGFDALQPENRLPDVSEGELRSFMGEVSESREGRMVLAQNAAALVRSEVTSEASDIVGGEPTALGNGVRLATAHYTVLGEAWNDVQLDRVAQREALVAGWRSVTDPVVDLVSGRTIESLPVVSTAADLPLVKNVVDAVTGQIEEGINSAVYDNLVPAPEVEAMTTWSDAIAPQVDTAVLDALYDDPQTRAHFVQLAQGDPDDAARWQQANADGQVTREEFAGLSDVQDAVSAYGDEIVDGFESQMAFDKTFG